MAKFMLVYHPVNMKMPASQEEGQKHMQDWKLWLDSLGDAVIEPNNPIKNSHWVKSDLSIEDKSANKSFMGYSVIEAQDLDQALEMVKSSPFLKMGGEIEVAEIMQMM